MKSQSRESLADDSGRYRPATVDKDSGSWGCRLQVGPDAGMTLDGVEEYLTYRTTRAEIMEYLNQAYGSAFVEDFDQTPSATASGNAQPVTVALPNHRFSHPELTFEYLCLGLMLWVPNWQP